MEEKKKKCSKCLDEKSLELFSKNKGNKDGHESRCKDCMKEKMQVYRDMKAGLEHGPAKRGRKTPRRAKIRPNPPTLQRASPPAEALRRAGKPSPTVTRSTPEQIIADLRRGLAIEIIDMIQEKYGI